MNSVNDNPLGKVTEYPTAFDADLLFTIPRTEARSALGLDTRIPFVGYDRWSAYELSWLNAKGKPEMRVAEFVVDALSPAIVESKSLKLYLNSYNQTTFSSEQAVIKQLTNDLSRGFGGNVEVALYDLDDTHSQLNIDHMASECIDDLDIAIEHYHPKPDLLFTENKTVNNEILSSHCLKTNCPITDQPDWASIYIEYSGKRISPEALLRYIVSFRQHQGYHENCVERIFCDIKRYCEPEQLTIYARYTRRGGLDINPLRSDADNQNGLLWGRVIRGLRQ